MASNHLALNTRERFSAQKRTFSSFFIYCHLLLHMLMVPSGTAAMQSPLCRVRLPASSGGTTTSATTEQLH